MTTPVKAALVAALMLGGIGAAGAQDLEKVTVAIGQGGKWDASIPQLGLDQSIFKKHGLDLDILYTQAGDETQ